MERNKIQIFKERRQKQWQNALPRALNLLLGLAETDIFMFTLPFVSEIKLKPLIKPTKAFLPVLPTPGVFVFAPVTPALFIPLLLPVAQNLLCYIIDISPPTIYYPGSKIRIPLRRSGLPI